ncbi:hypothetical protein AKO1_011481 [Acrasis kona]|uniref:Uncharacterized protein n=1 Tax=Acrasis kona TaxID=1008807 RepID=A0AAW2Z388_9EUKA
MKCFNMPITQIPSTTVYLSPLPVINASTTPADMNKILLEWRSQVNVIQRLQNFGETAFFQYALSSVHSS